MESILYIYADDTKYWFLNGIRHREDGPAIAYPDGSEFWYLNGKRHRVDGPAVIDISGYQAWYLNGILHRVDGPAIINAGGDIEFWAFGTHYGSLDDLVIDVIMNQ